jgi:hypothetical protein
VEQGADVHGSQVKQSADVHGLKVDESQIYVLMKLKKVNGAIFLDVMVHA